MKRSSSLLTPSHDCLCTKAIVEYVGLSFLGRLSFASLLYCSESRLRGRSFYTFTRDPKTAQHGIGDASLGGRFYVLT